MNASARPPAIELSWVLPLFRTAAHLDELLARIRLTSERLGLEYEVILVDDACPERCGALAEIRAARDDRLRVLHLPRNLGQDDALREGLRASGGEWAVILDADLQDPPEAVAQLWAARDDGVDIVFAQRRGAYTTRGRLLTSRLYRRAVATLGGLPPGACLFALLARPLITRINGTHARGIALLALIAASGTRFRSVAVARSRRASGVSSYSSRARFMKAARSLWQIFAARHLNRAF
jgi:polyisoprenyl-phosphate glycosyltransferase